ncbi:MAG TPA: cardiolipin synthase [Woeseiaceae bacterium]|nr:cardiolipin synthase [Woeseiaceae bacterium]
MTQISGANGRMTQTAADVVLEASAKGMADPELFEDLMRVTASLSDAPLYLDNQVDLLIDGPATYNAMLTAIAAAKSRIYLETYIFADDKVGRKFARQLMQKAREGLHVRLIYDSFGSLKSDDDFFAKMRDSGIEIVEFHDINPLSGGNPLNINVRDHRKLLIVDSEVAFTGGINLSSTYSSSSSSRKNQDLLNDGWRDTHVAIRGPAVAGFEALFRSNWLKHGGASFELVSAAESQVSAGGDIVAVLGSVGGDDEGSAIFHAYMDAIEKARKSIWITQAYFAPDENFLDTLVAAAARGVDVRIIVPGVSDSKLVLNASRSRYEKLLAANIRIYERNASLLHAKTAVIDGVWSTVGSSNLDYRSSLHNDEVNAVIFGTAFGRQLEQQFREDLRESQPIELNEWRARGFVDRLLEWASWPLEYWL